MQAIWQPVTRGPSAEGPACDECVRDLGMGVRESCIELQVGLESGREPICLSK